MLRLILTTLIPKLLKFFKKKYLKNTDLLHQ
jgi:hypothetical protein